MSVISTMPTDSLLGALQQVWEASCIWSTSTDTMVAILVSVEFPELVSSSTSTDTMVAIFVSVAIAANWLSACISYISLRLSTCSSCPLVVLSSRPLVFSSSRSIVVLTSCSLSRRLVVLSVSRDVHLVAWWSCQLVCLLSCGPRVV